MNIELNDTTMDVVVVDVVVVDDAARGEADEQRSVASRARRAGGEGGFSLVELLVVITIIGILATAVTVKVIDALGQAKVAKAKATVAKMKDAIGLYMIAEGRLPDSLEDLKNPIKGYEDGVLDGSLKDPWGQEYEYEQISSRKYIIRCYGADKQPGGEGEDGDIDSDTLGGDEESE